MPNTITYKISHEFELGLELDCTIDGSRLWLCFIVHEVDFDLIPQVLPADRFNGSGSVHVSQINHGDDISLELANMIELANVDDTVIFFVTDKGIIQTVLTTLDS